MYLLKPFSDSHPPPIVYPDCMYPMKNMNDANVNSDEVNSLEKRQNEILERLERLRINVVDITARRGICSENTMSASPPGLLNLAVHADPSHPPLSLFILIDLLRSEGQRIFITNHVHSSLLASTHISRFNQLVDSELLGIPRHQCDILIAVVWKSLPSPCDCRIILNSFRHHTLFGEAMLMRCLWSLLSNKDMTLGESSTIDLIDTGLLFSSSKENQITALKSLAVSSSCKEKKVGPVAAFLCSALCQTGLHLGKTVPSAVQEWVKTCFCISSVFEKVAIQL